MRSTASCGGRTGPRCLTAIDAVPAKHNPAGRTVQAQGARMPSGSPTQASAASQIQIGIAGRAWAARLGVGGEPGAEGTGAESCPRTVLPCPSLYKLGQGEDEISCGEWQRTCASSNARGDPAQRRSATAARDGWRQHAVLLAHLALQVVVQADLVDEFQLGFQPFDVLFGVRQDVEQ